jgi:hypothetical protein
MKGLIYIFGLLLFSCNSVTDKDETFVAINLETAEKDFKEKYKNLSAGEIPPPPPIVYYSKHNIIVDDEGCLFYFTIKDKGNQDCGTGITNDKKPEFLRLTPSELIKVPEDSIKSFVQKVRPEYGKLFISFSSVKDTFQSPSLSKLIKLYDYHKTLTAYSLRIATTEEKVVLEHKKSGRPYNPNEINWNPANIDIATLPAQ